MEAELGSRIKEWSHGIDQQENKCEEPNSKNLEILEEQLIEEQQNWE